MSRRRLVPALALLLCSLGGGSHAGASEPSLSDMAANLQRLQVAIGAGDKVAFAALPAQLRVIGEGIEAAKPEVWAGKKEPVAVIIYLLGGGDPQVVARLLQSGALPKDQEPLMRGALSYVLGRAKEAASLIGTVDPRGLDLRIAGQFAYILSVLEIPKDTKKAIRLLDLARLLAPGGLVEEAAIRREILLTAEQRDSDQTASLARQYFARFGHSLYADSFVQGFATMVAQHGLAEDLERFEMFRRATAAMAPKERQDFLATVARGALVAGRLAVAAAAAREVLSSGANDNANGARARFYLATVRTLTENYEEGIAELRMLPPSGLDMNDRALLSVARELTAHLRDLPRIAVQGNQPPVAKESANKRSDAPAITIAFAEAALGRTQAFSEAGAP